MSEKLEYNGNNKLYAEENDIDTSHEFEYFDVESFPALAQYLINPDDIEISHNGLIKPKETIDSKLEPSKL